ncbi:MAG: DUF1834 family protein [Sulfuriferula sp.]
MIAEIEDAILTRIGSANDGRLGYKFASLDSYGGEFDEDLNQVIRRFPALWVTYAGGGKPVPYGTKKARWKMPATFAVLVGARSVRGEPFSRRGLNSPAGAVVEVGTYRMLDDARRMLLNQDFGLAITRLELGAVKTLYNTRMNGIAVSAFAQEWHTSFMIDPEAIDPTTPEWLRLGINYYLAPDDGIADASDTVTLA